NEKRTMKNEQLSRCSFLVVRLSLFILLMPPGAYALRLAWKKPMSLIVADLRKDYPTPSGPLAVVRGVSLALDPGQAAAVMGPSGCGKSTFLNIVGTLDRPTGGEVTLEKQNPFSLEERPLAAFRNKQIGFVFQDHHLLPQCSALEN